MTPRQQRDQFMAFAFTSADLCLEVGPDGRIMSAMGAAAPLGVSLADALVGLDVGAIVDAADRPLISRLITALKPGRRGGPICVQAAGESAEQISMSALVFPGAEGRTYVTVAYLSTSVPAAGKAERDAGTGLVAQTAYADVAADAIADLRSHGLTPRMTMVSLGGHADLMDRLEPDAATRYMRDVGSALRAASAADAASEVGEGQFSVIHDEQQDITSLESSIDKAARTADPEGVGVTIGAHSFTIDPSLSSADAARALAFTVTEFAQGCAGEGVEATNLEAMCEALQGRMREVGDQMGAFKRAINDRSVEFVAQPIVNLKTGEVHHYELLARFERDQSPFQMVHFAEETGVVAELDLAAVEAAATFLKAQKRGQIPSLAVNLSGVSLTNPQFVTKLIRVLLKHKVDPKRLAFEITESARITELDVAHAFIQRIRKTGHPVYLDDFGAGAASFQYLRALDVDAIKIDGCYVRAATRSKKDSMLLKAMVGLCRDLGVLTVAEQVESQHHVTNLARLGVDLGQGFLYGRPVPLEEIARSAAA